MQINHTRYFRPRTQPLQYIIIHCSVGNPESMQKTFDQYQVSSHYIISNNGDIIETCSPLNVAYHAGNSHWLGSHAPSLNEISIGIELATSSLGQLATDYPAPSLASLITLLQQLSQQYHIRPENILGHSDVSPDRKPDPGIAFPWAELATHNLGLWFDLQHLSPLTDEQQLLSAIGYNTDNLLAARIAFCRHFYPQAIAVDTDIQHLVNNPIDSKFVLSDSESYYQILRAVAYAYCQARQN